MANPYRGKENQGNQDKKFQNINGKWNCRVSLHSICAGNAKEEFSAPTFIKSFKGILLFETKGHLDGGHLYLMMNPCPQIVLGLFFPLVTIHFYVLSRTLAVLFVNKWGGIQRALLRYRKTGWSWIMPLSHCVALFWSIPSHCQPCLYLDCPWKRHFPSALPFLTLV